MKNIVLLFWLSHHFFADIRRSRSIRTAGLLVCDAKPRIFVFNGWNFGTLPQKRDKVTYGTYSLYFPVANHHLNRNDYVVDGPHALSPDAYRGKHGAVGLQHPLLHCGLF